MNILWYTIEHISAGIFASALQRSCSFPESYRYVVIIFFTSKSTLPLAGPGDMLDSVSRDTATPISAHFPKTPHAPPTPPSVGTTPSLPVPDLDRSAISIAQDHITSGSTSSTVSLSGDYKDLSGKVIRR